MSMQISLVQQLEQHKEETWDVRFSLDGKRLVSSDGKAIYLWQLDDRGNWEYERSFPFSAALPCLAPDGKLLAFRDRERMLRLISLDGGGEVATFPSPALTDCAFSPDQRWLVSGDTARNILLWDLLTSQYSIIPVPFPNEKNETGVSNETVRGIRFTPDGQRLVFGASSDEGYVHICHVDPLQKSLTLQKSLPRGMIELAIAPNGKRLALVDTDGVYVYDLESLQLLHTFPYTITLRYGLIAFSPDSQFLMSSKSDGTVDIWSVATFECFACVVAHPGLMTNVSDPIGGLDWSSTGYIATGGASAFKENIKKKDYTIKIWKVEQ